MDIRVHRAEPGDAEGLTTLAHEAKRHWGYSEQLIELWRTELTFAPDYIARHAVYVARMGGDLVGVYALVRSGGEAELDHLWVRPDYSGRGIGRALLEHAIATARAWNATAIKIVSDPNAEGFYRKMGAERIGDAPSRPEGRRLPVLILDV